MSYYYAHPFCEAPQPSNPTIQRNGLAYMWLGNTNPESLRISGDKVTYDCGALDCPLTLRWDSAVVAEAQVKTGDGMRASKSKGIVGVYLPVLFS